MNGQFSIVTELPGSPAPKEQLSRLYHRYHFAAGFCANKSVLEVACGPGVGLGYLAKSARKVVGCDIDEYNLSYAVKTYSGRANVEVCRADAQKLPFADHGFDVVILYEAIYYLSEPDVFVAEAKRVLRADGVLIICSVNKDWADFCPSPHSRHYLSAAELHESLQKNFAHVRLYGAFPATTNSARDRLTSFVKKTAIFLHVMPKTMKGKVWLKRLFFGRLSPLPSELSADNRDYTEPTAMSPAGANGEYKVLYATGSDGRL